MKVILKDALIQNQNIEVGDNKYYCCHFEKCIIVFNKEVDEEIYFFNCHFTNCEFKNEEIKGFLPYQMNSIMSAVFSRYLDPI